MKRLDDISILRVLCILVVVFFHCYGMMYADAHFPNTVSVYESLYFIPNQCIFINIAMPMFVVVSGYLFSYLLQLGKYPTWGNLLRKKGLRILLPYFLFGLLFMATTGNWHPLQLLNGEYWHLWFLPMLFWCFIVGYGIHKVRTNIYFELVLLLFILAEMLFPAFRIDLPRWIGLHNIFAWFYWFYLGMLIAKCRAFLFGRNNKYYTILYLLLFLASASIVCLFPIEYVESTWYSVLAVTTSVVSALYLMGQIDWNRLKVTVPLVRFSDYSFGIYIWHNWVALMLISNTSKQLFGLPELAASHVVLFPLCFSLITLAISWTLSWMMMKTKVGRFLIG